jgi:hypothetical protein
MVRLFVSYLVAAAFLASSSTNAFSTAGVSRVARAQTSDAQRIVIGVSSPSSSYANNVISSSSTLAAMLTQTELPEKVYLPADKEIAKVLGGLKIGSRKLTGENNRGIYSCLLIGINISVFNFIIHDALLLLITPLASDYRCILRFRT